MYLSLIKVRASFSVLGVFLLINTMLNASYINRCCCAGGVVRSVVVVVIVFVDIDNCCYDCGCGCCFDVSLLLLLFLLLFRRGKSTVTISKKAIIGVHVCVSRPRFG